MAVNVVLNGVSYTIPDPGDTAWGQDTTDYMVAQASGLLQKAGGVFSLTAEVDFGATFGLKSAYFKSRTANPATAGQIRLANTDGVAWRNFANDGNLRLEVNSSNELVYNNGVISQPIQGQITPVDTATIDLTLAGSNLSAAIVTGSITNAMINASAAIAYSKLNLSGGVVNTDVSASAAIAYSKLNLTGGIVNSDVSASAAIAYSKLNLALGIVNADISASAAIARSKVAVGTINHVVINDGSGNLSSEASLAISRGGTGAGTKAAGFDALSPMTTGGDIIYGGASGTGTRLTNGSVGQFLRSGGGTNAPTWAAVTVTPTATQAKSANYTLTTADDTILFTTSTSTLIATLPTAVGISGQRFTIKKVDTGTGLVSIATTSAQTVDGYASGTFKMASRNDFISLESDGSNWQVVDLLNSVTASYYSSANNNIGTTQSGNYDAKIYDTYSAVTAAAAGTGTWKFTAPFTGYYRVSGAIFFTAITAPNLLIYKNGTLLMTAGNTLQGQNNYSCEFLLSAGDFFDVRTNASVTQGGGSPGSSICSIQVSLIR